MKRVLCAFSVLLFVLAFAGLASAQPFGWLGDDGFQVPWCTPVTTTNLPSFPALTQTGTYCCLQNCNLAGSFPVTVVTGHQMILCDYAIIFITVVPTSAGGPGWTGAMLAKYSRTWTEPTVPGIVDRQVWRFLINGDLTPTAGAPPCPLPPHPAGSLTHWQGHIDYACDVNSAGNLVFSQALNLNHLPGCISHNFLSAAPLPAPFDHPDRSYHLFSPGSFVCTPVPEPQGPILAEDLRSTNFFPNYLCLGEAPVIQGNLVTPIPPNCLCVSAPPGAFPWYHQFLTGTAICGGTTQPFVPLPIAPPLPPLPTGFATLSLGVWTNPPGVFPGQRALAIHWGVLQMQDGCNPNDIPVHIVSGVTTSGVLGSIFFVNPVSPPLMTHFMDLGDQILFNGLFGPYTLGWGTLYITKRVWNLNIP